MAIPPSSYALLPAVAAFVVTAFGTHLLIPRLKRSGLVGRDVHKADHSEVPEMGGIAIFGGIVAGVSVAIAIETFLRPLYIRTPMVSAALATVGVIAAIGLVDDLLDIRQRTKAFLPVFSSLPLVATAAGNPIMFVPFLGAMNLGVYYPLVVVPLAITGAANATNMLAGWNGVEAGLGVVLFGTLSIQGALSNNTTVLAIALPGAAACLAFAGFNSFPARVFPGDVGAMTIGAAFGAAVIVGNVEMLGAFLLVPFAIDFAMKARHGFPKTFAQLEGGRLVCPRGEPPKGLGQLFLRLSGGMKEPTLVVSLLAFEALFGLLGLAIVSSI